MSHVRRWTSYKVRAGVTGAVLLSLLTAACTAQAARVACGDALTTNAVGSLQSFVDWLHDNHVRGAIGEVGWPATADSPSWTQLATRWDDVARASKLSVLMWVASEWLPASYQLRVAAPAAPPAGVLTTVGPQLNLMLTANKGTGAIGVNDGGGEFGTPASFSNASPGKYGTAWHFDSLQTLKLFASQGIRTVRVPIRWERLQPKLGGPLDPSAVKQLERYLVDAQTAGLTVVLDVHNFGQYDQASAGSSGTVNVLHLGSSALPSSDLANLWTLLVDIFGQYPAIDGWDIMNEPVLMPPTDGSSAKTWELASQAAVDAIRKAGDVHTVWVEGYNYAADGTFASLTPKAWIKDPAHAVVYEAHAYFDEDGSGQYQESYAADEAKAAAHEAKQNRVGAKVCPAQ
jgi:Cellulase (glycosyl hydrolase family 5)